MNNLKINIFVLLLSILLSNVNSNVNIIYSELKQTKVLAVNFTHPSIILYNFPYCENKFIRVKFESKLIGNQSVIIKSKSDDSEFKIMNKYNQSIVNTERSICSISQENLCDKKKSYVFKITTVSSETLYVNVTAFPMLDMSISIGENRSITIDDNSPTYWLLKFNDTNVDMQIRIDSEDNHCMYAFIEHAQCSVNILNPHLETIRIKTITTKGSIPIKNTGHFKNSLFIVFILAENDICKQNLKTRNASIKEIFRQKKFNISFVHIDTNYRRKVFGTVSIFVSFGLLYILFYYFYYKCPDQKNEGPTNRSENKIAMTKCSKVCKFCCGIYHPDCNCTDQKNKDFGTLFQNMKKCSCFKLDGLKTIKKFFNFRGVQYSINCNFIFAISVFYGLPVIQLLWHFLKIMNTHGNFDDCYFNDHCSKPWKIFISFNNVISNLGYIILGITFMIIVYINRCFMRKISLNSPKCGIFYALGFSLIMEGILSGSYHICPKRETIQFDATFMYIIGYLLNVYCAIRLLQMFGKDEVNTDEKLKSFLFFMSFVMLIIVVFLIVEFKDKLLNMCINMIFQTLFISISYYKIFSSLKEEFSCVPHYMHVIIVILLNFIPFGFVYMSEKGFYLSFLIGIITSFFYLLICLLFMFEKKLRLNCPSNKNHKSCKYFCSNFFTLNFFGLLIFWISAICFFLKAPTDWKTTASESREYNQDCVWWDFYDIHDIWHILSSVALFLSFMWILTIDGNMFIINSNISKTENRKRSTI